MPKAETTGLKVEQWPIERLVPRPIGIKVEWRDIPLREGYMVNSLGEVWSKDRRIEKSDGRGGTYIATLRGRKLRTWSSNAYLYCSLGRELKCGVHRLVCIAFHGMPENEKLEAAHLDGNAHNNVPDNLVWVTHAENEQMKKKHGTYYMGRGPHPMMPWHKKRGPKPTVHPDAQKMIEMRKNGAKWDEIAKAFGVSRSGAFGIVKFRSEAALCR